MIPVFSAARIPARRAAPALAALAWLAACLLAAPAQAQAQGQGQGQGQPPAAGAVSTEAWYAVPDARGVQVVHIECGPGFIDPREIVVEPGRPVELAVRSNEAQQEFVMPLLPPVALAARPVRQQFVPTARGSHAMACRQQGAGDAGTPARKRGRLHVGAPEAR